MQKHAEKWSKSNGNIFYEVPQTQCLCGFWAFLKFVGLGERNKFPKYHIINDIQSQENKEVIFWRTNCIAAILSLYVIFYLTKELDI